MRITNRTRSVLSVPTFLLAGALVLGACSGGDEPAGEEAPEAQQTADGSTLAGRWPLTGLPADGAAPKHPVMVVKIDNTASSRPQVGLSGADMVAEELVEGGSTRLAAFYYSQVPKRVGPVRSMRATDIGIVKPADGVLVAAGGAPPTRRRVSAADIKVFGEGDPGFSRDSGRSAPYNLFVALPALARTLKDKTPPAPYFTFGDEQDLPKGQPARRVDATFSGGHTTSWTYRKGGYVNTNSNAAAGDRFRPDTLLVLRVKVGDAGYLDPAGNPVPETKFTGRGTAMVFRDGQMVRGTWQKKGLEAPVELRHRGKELALPAGKVWLELVPAKGGDVSVRP